MIVAFYFDSMHPYGDSNACKGRRVEVISWSHALDWALSRVITLNALVM